MNDSTTSGSPSTGDPLADFNSAMDAAIGTLSIASEQHVRRKTIERFANYYHPYALVAPEDINEAEEAYFPSLHLSVRHEHISAVRAAIIASYERYLTDNEMRSRVVTLLNEVLPNKLDSKEYIQQIERGVVAGTPPSMPRRSGIPAVKAGVGDWLAWFNQCVDVPLPGLNTDLMRGLPVLASSDNEDLDMDEIVSRDIDALSSEPFLYRYRHNDHVKEAIRYLEERNRKLTHTLVADYLRSKYSIDVYARNYIPRDAEIIKLEA